MDKYQVMLPAKVVFGDGCINTVGDEAKRMGAKHALVVTDPGVLKAGIAEPVKKQLSQAGVTVDVFTKQEAEPTLTELNAKYEDVRNEDIDLLIGIGGGSSMDTAKGLSVLLAHGGRGQDYMGVEKIPGPCLPVITMPTTAGTGSEVTPIAVFDFAEKGYKTGMVSPYILARVALVDPTLTYGCPPKVTASSGIDALVHAIEAYTCKKAQSFSDALALEAMRLIIGSLRTAVKDGSNREARNHMSEGALLAGMSFGNASTAVVHAVSQALGSRYHTPHGTANGLFLPYVLEYNLSADLPRHATVAKMLGVKTEGLSLQEAAKKGVEAAKALATDIGIPLHLRELGVPEDALDEMAVVSMDAKRLFDNNARQLTLDDVKQIWRNAW